MVYIEVVILINFLFDFTLLNIVDLLLKRNTKSYRTILGALSGELSILILFIKLTNIESILFKIILSLIMSIVTFGYKNKKYSLFNIIYLYLTGIILGGFMTYLYNEFKINREYSYRYILVLLLGLIFLFIYYKCILKFKRDYSNRYLVSIYYDGNTYEATGYLDSGNKLVSPYSNSPIILVEKEYISLHRLKIIPVPFCALNHHGILNCFKPDLLLIDGKRYENVLVGLSDKSFNIDGCTVLLNSRLENL